MNPSIPTYLDIPAAHLGDGTNVRVTVAGDMQDIATRMAATMFDTLTTASERGMPATLIVPVGPVDQFPILAETINAHGFDCRNVMLINMDEYLDDEQQWIDLAHPLSFRSYMNRKFYDLLAP